MIIPDSFKRAYDSAELVWKSVKSEADGILRQIAGKCPGANYYSRIKGLESVFVKTQKGEYENPLREMEDFFAGTLVLPTLTMIEPVKTEIAQHFDITAPQVKPPDPYLFRYSDLNFILSLKDTPLRPDKSVLGLKFELQIKTLLQSAWSQAGHDIIYKPSRISWGVERIAGEIRALLELADNVLAQIEATAQLLHSQAEQEYAGYMADTKRIIEIMEQHWKPSDLPANRRRMAEIVRNYKDMAGITTDDLAKLVEEARSANDQVFDFLTITPTQKVFVLVFRSYSDKVKKKLQSGKFRVLITPEMAGFYPELAHLDKELDKLDKGKVEL